MTSVIANLSLAPAPVALARGARTSAGTLGYVRDLPSETREEVSGLLSFRVPPIPEELRARAERLADIATDEGATQVRLDVPGCLRSPLEAALRRRGATPLFDAGKEGLLVEGGSGGAFPRANTAAIRPLDHRIFNLTGRPTAPAEADEGVVDPPRFVADTLRDLSRKSRSIGSPSEARMHAKFLAQHVADSLRTEANAKPPFQVLFDGPPALTSHFEAAAKALGIAVLHPVHTTKPDAAGRHEAISPSVACGTPPAPPRSEPQTRFGFLNRVRNIAAAAGIGHPAPSPSCASAATPHPANFQPMEVGG